MEEKSSEEKEVNEVAWEIRRRVGTKTLWQSRDAEGRRVYAVTQDRNGVAVEPTGAAYRTIKAAMAAAGIK